MENIVGKGENASSYTIFNDDFCKGIVKSHHYKVKA